VAQPTDFNGKEYAVTVLDADRIRLVGTNTAGVSSYTSGGTVKVSAAGSVFEDSVTDAALELEEYLSKSANYAEAPAAKYSAYVRGQMWLFGIAGESCRAFYSESAGGDQACPTEDALAYPKKYASMFRDDYAVVCESEVALTETGFAALINDLYFFFEERIYALFNADTTQSPAKVSSDIGLMFPYTLTPANIGIFGGECILFMSNRGPAVLRQGGQVELLSVYKIKELWPKLSEELYGDLTDYKETIVKNCTAAFWKDTWWVMYKNHNGTNRVFGYYFNPEQAHNSDAARGAFELTMAEV
jgi:hypothetical protein